MKKLFLLLAPTLLLGGCWVYGSGETVGNVYAVDDGLFWSRAWIKTTLESSESDCYVFDGDELRGKLMDVSGGAKVKLKYKRHFSTASACSNDEITSVEIVK